MAVSLIQQPTSPNGAYTRLLYVASGSVTTSNPQYQYVMDIYESGSSDMITRVTQTPNPAGTAVFDPSRIFQGELEQDNIWNILNGNAATGSGKTFIVNFGEQYGTSVSSSVTVYPDLQNTEIDITPAVVDPNNGISYNFQSGSYLPVSGAEDIVLSNDPLLLNYGRKSFTEPGTVFKPVGVLDYETVSYLNDATDPYTTYDVVLYANDTVLKTITDKNLNIGSTNAKMVYVGVGPQNLMEANADLIPFFTTETWSHYTVTIKTAGASFTNTVYFANEAINPTILHQITFNGNLLVTTVPPISQKEKVRFAWINEYGVWDYYNVYNAVKRSSNITKQNVTLPQVDYSSTSSPYNVNNRGEKNYYTEVKDTFTIETSYIGKNVSNWLEEMLESPSVYLQRGSQFIPVVITNSNYTSNTHQARQKLFQYTINFQPANQPYGEWVPEYIQLVCPDFQFRAKYDLCLGTGPQLQLLQEDVYTFPPYIYDGEWCYQFTERGGTGEDGDVTGLDTYSNCPECDAANFTYVSLGYKASGLVCEEVPFAGKTVAEVVKTIEYSTTIPTTYSTIKYRITDSLSPGTQLYNADNTQSTLSGNFSLNVTLGPVTSCNFSAVGTAISGQIISLSSGVITGVFNAVDYAGTGGLPSGYVSATVALNENVNAITYNKTRGLYYYKTYITPSAGDRPGDLTSLVSTVDDFSDCGLVLPNTNYTVGWKRSYQNNTQADTLKTYKIDTSETCPAGNRIRNLDTPQAGTSDTGYMHWGWRHYNQASSCLSQFKGTAEYATTYNGEYKNSVFTCGPLEIGIRLWGGPATSNITTIDNPPSSITGTSLKTSTSGSNQFFPVEYEGVKYAVATDPTGYIVDVRDADGNTPTFPAPEEPKGQVFWIAPFFAAGYATPTEACGETNFGLRMIDPITNLQTISTGSSTVRPINFTNLNSCTYPSTFVSGSNGYYGVTDVDPDLGYSNSAARYAIRIDGSGIIQECIECASL
jgi:hypothetical protein